METVKVIVEKTDDGWHEGKLIICCNAKMKNSKRAVRKIGKFFEMFLKKKKYAIEVSYFDLSGGFFKTIKLDRRK